VAEYVLRNIPVANNCRVQLKKITTILLLASFLVFQYARQVSYWECRVSNSFKANNEKCDCEQLVDQVADQGEPFPASAHNNHFHVDDGFYPAGAVAIKKSIVINQSSRGMTLTVFLNNIIASRLERPPQML